MRGHGLCLDLGWQEKSGSCVDLSALIDGRNGNSGQKYQSTLTSSRSAPRKWAQKHWKHKALKPVAAEPLFARQGKTTEKQGVGLNSLKDALSEMSKLVSKYATRGSVGRFFQGNNFNEEYNFSFEFKRLSGILFLGIVFVFGQQSLLAQFIIYFVY